MEAWNNSDLLRHYDRHFWEDSLGKYYRLVKPMNSTNNPWRYAIDTSDDPIKLFNTIFPCATLHDLERMIQSYNEGSKVLLEPLLMQETEKLVEYLGSSNG